MSITVKADDMEKVADGTVASGFNYTIEGVTDADEIARIKGELGEATFGGEAKTAVNAGSYTITVSFASNSNYTVTCTSGTLTITAPATTGTTATTTTPVTPNN
jgi:hypothetical protein